MISKIQLVREMISKILLSIILLTSLLTKVTHSQENELLLVYNFCLPKSSGNFTQNSFYQKNLNSLLKNLVSRSSTVSFYNTTSGSSPDEVYGLFSCRYDLPSETCKTCVETAVERLTTNCTKEKEAIAWYTQCTLRYSDTNIFAQAKEFPVSWWLSTLNVSMDLDQFNKAFIDSLATVINQAAYNSSLTRKYFKTSVTYISSLDTLYVLVQCTPDIDSDSCAQCLKSTVRDLPARGRTWAMFLRPSCQMMYNMTAFFQVSITPPQSPTTPSPLSPSSSGGKGIMYYIIRAAIPAAVGLLLLLGICLCLLIRVRGRRKTPTDLPAGSQPPLKQGRDTGAGFMMNTTDQCVQFELKTLEVATNKFSQANKLGQGGFGIVYRGVLQNGQQVAVKRLSMASVQGAKEFKTEVELVAQLQHKNLVRLAGYCFEREEQLLVYEFMPNLSLDNFLFGSVRATSLTWAVRYKIIVGIARGLHYLHEDSRIKIVHRDLKTSNILLDDNLEPKIADFGMARLMQVNQTQANTTKIVGTFGYIAPEYALVGRCTPKSDIYSFGVIILEILSGKSCSQFYQRSHGEGLLRYAWRVWSEDTIENLMDPVLQNNYTRNEVERCLRIGLLCVQDDEANRPTTQALLIMLSSNSAELPSPFAPSIVSNSINMPSAGGDPQDGQSTYKETNQTVDTRYLEKDLYAR